MTEPQITVYAETMLTAQCVTLDHDTHQRLQAQADTYRRITKTTDPTHVRVPVRDPREPHSLIGYLDYTL